LASETSLLRKLVFIVRDKDASLYVRKALAHALANFASVESLRTSLAAVGTPVALQEVQQDNLLRRKAFDLALRQIAGTVMSSSSTAAEFRDIGTEDMRILQEIHELYGKKENSLFERIQVAIVNSGVALYLHTSAGGLVWGALESLRRKDSMRNIIKNSLKTSLVTGLVPICFVGLGVSVYTYLQHHMDTAEQRFYLTMGTCMSLYPWCYLLPVVERFSPFWIGGHVLGFMSFFTWMVISGNDLFKTDSLIVQYDQKMHDRKVSNSELKQ